MGCDIHTYIEKKKKGKWISAQGFMEIEKGQPLDVPYPDRFYSGRNYTLFGVLTNGAVRYEPTVSLFCEPRGLPKDCCKEVKIQYNEWEGDAHNTSYLTLKELTDADWDSLDLSEQKDCDEFRRNAVHFMQLYDSDCKVHEIRMVFWFDN